MKIFESTMQISEAASGHVPSNLPVNDMMRNITPAKARHTLAVIRSLFKIFFITDI